MPTTDNIPVDGAHVWVAAIVAIVALAVATLVLCGFRIEVMRKLVIGADQRASTSKFQAAAWTYVICFALLTLFVGHVLYADFDPGWDAFLESGLNSDYLWLLGIPSAGLAGAKVITEAKAADDPAAKVPSTNTEATLVTRVRELGSDDNDTSPEPALADLQYLIFGTIALLYFLGGFLAHVEAGLPSLPESLIALTGVSAATYLAAKAVTRTAAPAIASVRPRTVKLGPSTTPLVISGTGFIPPLVPGKPAAMLGGVDLAVDDGATATQLVASVPTATDAASKGLTAGTLDLVVLTSVGTPSEPVQIVLS